MRGLDIRIHYAQRKLALAYRPEEEVELWVPIEDAQAMGVYEYREGIEEAPLLFVGEPALLAAWEAGQHFAWESEEMASCPGCHDPELPLCPIHG